MLSMTDKPAPTPLLAPLVLPPNWDAHLTGKA
jgi:hypothetical protein